MTPPPPPRRREITRVRHDSPPRRYYEAGLISPAFIVWSVFWGFFSGQLGQRGVNHVIKKTGRPSYVIFLLGSIIGVACATITLGFIARAAQGDVDTKFNISAFLCTKSNSKS